MIVAFIVDQEPVPTARARVTSRGTFTPKRSIKAQEAVRDAFLAATVKERLAWDLNPERAVYLGVTFARGTFVRADLDNLLKTVLDGLNGYAYADDRQVTSLRAVVNWAPRLAKPKTPGYTQVLVEAMPQDMAGNPLPWGTPLPEPKD